MPQRTLITRNTSRMSAFLPDVPNATMGGTLEEVLVVDRRLAISPAALVERRVRKAATSHFVGLSNLLTFTPYKGRNLG